MASTRKNGFRRHSVFDLSDISLDASQMEDPGSLTFHRHPAQVLPAPSRFLKRDPSVGAQHFVAPEPAGQGRGSPHTTLAAGSQTRTNAVLRKVAQMETKILSRAKAHVAQSDTETDPKIIGRGPPKRAKDPLSQQVPGTFQTQGHEAPMAESPSLGGKGRRFLKTKGPAVEDRAPDTRSGPEEMPQTPWQKEPTRKLSSLDSNEEEMLALLGSLVESPREETHSHLGLPSDKVNQKEPGKTCSDQTLTQQRSFSVPGVELPGMKPPQMRSLPASGLAQGAPPGAHSRTCSLQTHVSGDPASHTASFSTSGPLAGSGSCTTGHSRLISSPGRSVAGPSEEVAPETGDMDDSLDDFRFNILSLDDLAPAVSEKSDLAQRGEKPPGSNLEVQALARLEAPGCPQSRSSVFQGTATSGVGDGGVPTESEISECLGGSVSSRRLWPAAHRSSPASMAYSEEFEHSPSCSKDTADGTLDTMSSSAGTALLPRPPSSRQPRARPTTRVMMREMAVQTLDVTFAGPWTEAAGMALGGTYMDPAPIAPHVVSTDAIEAHSPAAAALDDLLRQHLQLTKQFIEASRHLHVSLLQSLDRDTFHYHSLEEAKEFIRCHRPNPLTMEDALQKVAEET